MIRKLKNICLIFFVSLFFICCGLFLKNSLFVNAADKNIDSDYIIIFNDYQIENYESGSSYKVIDPHNNEVSLTEGCFFVDDLGVYKIYKNDVLISYLKSVKEDLDEKFENLFTGNNLVSVNSRYDFSSTNPNAGRGLLLVSEGANSYIYYKNQVDLSKFSKENIFFNSFAERSDRSIFSTLTVSFIDVNDESNVVSITFTQSGDGDQWCYATVQFNGYSIGINNEKAPAIPRAIGTVVNASFKINDYKYPLGFRFDYGEMAFYNYSGSTKILDLDDEILLQGRTPFKGFSDGKVYVKISMSGSKSALFIDEFLSQKTADIANFNFNNDIFGYYYDGHFITSKSLNDGLIHRKYYLPVPKFDYMFDSTISYSYSLLFLENNLWVDISDQISGNEFIPTKIGNYKLKYVVGSPSYGCAIDELSFTVKDNIDDINIINEDLTYDLFDYMPLINFMSTGGSGVVKYDAKYFYNDEEVFADVNGYIYLNKVGSIRVEVKANDFLGLEAEKTINVSIIPRPVITIDEIPVSYFAGNEIVISDFTAINYCVNENEDGYFMPKKITVNDIELPDDRKFTPVKGIDKLEIKYIAGEGSTYETVETVVIPVITLSNDFDITDYIITNGDISVKLFDSGLKFDFSKDAQFSFPHAIPASELGLNFSLINGLHNYSSFDFIVEDYSDSSERVTINISGFYGWDLDQSGVKFTVKMGDYSASLKYQRAVYNEHSEFSNTKYFVSTLMIHNFEKALSDGANGILKYIRYFDSGNVFTGFSSGLVRLTVRFNGVKKASSFVLNSIANQNLTEYAFFNGDGQGPVIFINGVLNDAEYNAEYIIPPILAWDVLQGNSFIDEVKITKPSGAVITLLNTDIENKLLLDEYGNYKLKCKAEDIYGNVSNLSLNINVRDKEKPTLTIVDTVKTQYKINEEFVMPVFDARDNNEKTNISVFIKDSTSTMVNITGSFKFSKAGVYTVFIRATDNASNMCVESYSIEVKGE